VSGRVADHECAHVADESFDLRLVVLVVVAVGGFVAEVQPSRYLLLLDRGLTGWPAGAAQKCADSVAWVRLASRAMRPDEFFKAVPDALGWGPRTREVDHDLLVSLRRGPAAGKDDLEVGVALARLVHDDLEAYGTGGGEQLSEAEMRDALLALHAVAKRVGLGELQIPFRDYASFRSYWLRNDAYGSWQARRDILNGIFDPIHDQLIEVESVSITSSLAQPVSPRGRTGWAKVDEELAEMRRHFEMARTPQDYRNVGNDATMVTEALSRQVYDPVKHLRAGEDEPAVGKTKQRLERFVEDALPGRDTAALRRLVRASIEAAQEVKHSDTPTRRDAGVAADSVILLANLLRRLDEPAG
jgi:hypothetical protein